MPPLIKANYAPYHYLGDKLFGIRIELFYGLQTFNFIWFLQLFVWPVVVGLSVSFIYGLGGKWIALLPPLLVRFAAYYETEFWLGIPDGTDLMPMGWWMFFVILAMESAMFGGVFGEIAIKRVYGRTNPKDMPEKLHDAPPVIADESVASKGPDLPNDKSPG